MRDGQLLSVLELGRLDDHIVIFNGYVKMIYSPFGWNIFDKNLTVGGLFGYSSENSMTSLKVPVQTKIKRVR